MDKFKHFLICFVLSLYSTELALGCSVTKEWCDRMYSDGSNHFCWYDLFCDLVGVVIGTMLRMIIINRYNWI